MADCSAGDCAIRSNGRLALMALGDALPVAHQLGAGQQAGPRLGGPALHRFVLDQGVELGLMGSREAAEGQFLDTLG